MTNANETIGELGLAWLKRKQLLKPSAWRTINSTWRTYVEPKWGSREISSIKHTEVQVWLTDIAIGGLAPDGKPKSRTTVSRATGILRGILDDAVKDGLLEKNPARDLTLPRKTQRARIYLTHKNVDRLAFEAGRGGKYHAFTTLVYLLAYTGLRWGEAIALQVRDVDLLQNRISVNRNAVQVGRSHEIGTPKSNQLRRVGFPKSLAPLLAVQCQGKSSDLLVFQNATGGFIKQPNSNNGWFAAAVKRAQLTGVTPHKLRNTAASLAVSSGANVKALQRMLGHASAAMTLDVYADLFDDDLDAVAISLEAAIQASRGKGNHSFK